jgi:hypothetical protein
MTVQLVNFSVDTRAFERLKKIAARREMGFDELIRDYIRYGIWLEQIDSEGTELYTKKKNSDSYVRIMIA